jgi:protein-S-isoprenylcysteine O-methyltransferase Ste14
MKQWKMYILTYIWAPCLITQIVLVFAFGFYNEAGFDVVMYIGWLVWVISIVFGWVPIFVLKRRGGVDRGKSYVHTTKLVKSGIYAIIRHPQYTAGLLFSLALILISQTWLVTGFGIVVMVLLYVDIIMTDRYEIRKFGEKYKSYMKQVPRTNFLLGFIRLLKRR